MAVSFMLLGPPRAATTWAANWLTTDRTFCIHDPFLEYTIRELDNLTIPGRAIGISCTATLLYPDWYLKHPAKKVLLYRELDEVNASLDALELPNLESSGHHQRSIVAMDAGVHTFHWTALFMPAAAKEIWEILLPKIPFDEYRHDLLCGFNVQPQWRHLRVTNDAISDLAKRIKESQL